MGAGHREYDGATPEAGDIGAGYERRDLSLMVNLRPKLCKFGHVRHSYYTGVACAWQAGAGRRAGAGGRARAGGRAGG